MTEENFEVIDRREEEKPEESVLKKKVSFVQQVIKEDLLGPFMDAGLIGTKYQVSMISGKIEKIGPCHRVQSTDGPWIFGANNAGRNCDWQSDKQLVFKFVPNRCRNCWKTVVYPNGVHDTIKLMNLQEQMAQADPSCTCKTGMEVRAEVERNWGGYFYNNTKAGGLSRLKEVKALVEKFVGKGIKVILKRGCTEFERMYGDSKEWDKFAIYNDLENAIEDISYIEDTQPHQPYIVKKHILATWLKYAASIADPQFLELSDNERMYTDYSTYEEEGGDKHGKAKEKGNIKRYREKTITDK